MISSVMIEIYRLLMKSIYANNLSTFLPPPARACRAYITVLATTAAAFAKSVACHRGALCWSAPLPASSLFLLGTKHVQTKPETWTPIDFADVAQLLLQLQLQLQLCLHFLNTSTARREREASDCMLPASEACKANGKQLHSHTYPTNVPHAGQYGAVEAAAGVGAEGCDFLFGHWLSENGSKLQQRHQLNDWAN